MQTNLELLKTPTLRPNTRKLLNFNEDSSANAVASNNTVKQALDKITHTRRGGSMYGYNNLTVSPSSRRTLVGDNGILVTKVNNSAPRKVGIERCTPYSTKAMELNVKYETKPN
uniref:Uncharacterized protein n=1 Tax=Glossina austeni TaxID=7395 RepID=A0A1A9UGN1_GLOAU